MDQVLEFALEGPLHPLAGDSVREVDAKFEPAAESDQELTN